MHIAGSELTVRVGECAGYVLDPPGILTIMKNFTEYDET